MFWSVRPQWQQTASIDEFHPYHDDCGPNALENTASNLEDRAPSYTAMDDIRQDMINRGWFASGCTTGQLAAECGVRGYNPVRVWPYNANGYSAGDVRSALEQCPDGNHALIVELGAAGRLPMNEPNVQGHFIALLAYDSTPVRNAGQTGKALVANGDRVPVGGPDWLWIDDIAGADVIGMLLVARKGTSPTPAPIGGSGNAMAWHQQNDGSGVDDKGHTCGAGIMGAVLSSGEAGTDGLSSETYGASFGIAVPGVASWLPLENDALVIWNGTNAAVVGHGGNIAHALASLADELAGKLQAAQAQLQAAQAEETAEQQQPPAPAPQPDPKASAALAVLQQLKTILAEV